VLASVAICFVMDIDNMAREAFQSVSISEHVDDMHFETKMRAPVEHKSQGVARPVDMNVLKTFSSLDKSLLVLVLTCVVVFGLRFVFCPIEALLADDVNNI